MRKAIVTATMISVICIVGIVFQVFSLFQIQHQGYNPYSVQCENTCFQFLRTEVKIEKNGDALFEEEVTAYRKKAGNFFYIDHDYDTAIGEKIDKTSIALVSGDGELRPEFITSGSVERTRFKVNTRFSGTKKFKIQYRVSGLVKQLQDGQLFKYNFFNNAYGRPVMAAEFIINMPIPTQETNLFVDGLLKQSGILEMEAGYLVYVPQAKHTKQHYEVNLSLPKNAVSNASLIPKSTYQTIDQLNQNIQQVKQKEIDEEQSAISSIHAMISGMIVLNVVGIAIVVFVYIRKVKPKRVVNRDTAYWQIPYLLGPNTAGMIVAPDNQMNLNDGFKAGLLYLVSAGYATMSTEANNVVKMAQLNVMNDNEPKEIQELYVYLFGSGPVRYLGDKIAVDKAEDIKRFKVYQQQAITSFQDLGLYDGRGSLPGGYSSTSGILSLKTLLLVVVLGIGFAIYGIFLSSMNLVLFNGIAALAITVMSIVFISLYWGSSYRLRENKIAEYEQWIGYKNYLSNYTLLKERNINDLHVWKQHLVYATAFGVAETVLEVMRVEYPHMAAEIQMSMPISPLFYYSTFHMSPTISPSRSIGDFGSFGSGGGFSGGGFSGGGSGGGGGGFG